MSQNPTNTQTPLAVSIRTMGQDLAAIQKGQTPLPRVETVSAGPPEALPVEQLLQSPPTARPVTPPAQLESVLAPKTLLPQPLPKPLVTSAPTPPRQPAAPVPTPLKPALPHPPAVPKPPTPATPLTQPVKPIFSLPFQPPHPTIQPPPPAAPRPATPRIEPPTPKPPTAPQQAQPPAQKPAILTFPARPQPATPRAPAAGINRRKLILASSAVAVVILAAAGGAVWWFKFRPTTVTPPPPPPIVEPTEPTPIVASMAVLKVEASTPAGIPAAVTSAWANNGRGGVFDAALVKIVIPDGARRYATAVDIVASYPLNIPAVIRQDIADINLIRFTQTEFLTPSKESLPPDRFGIAIKFTVAPNPGTIAAWENMMASDLEPYLKLARFNAEPDVSSWKDSTHRGIAIRYMNFALPDQSFDYAFLPAQNLLLISTSRESMYALIDAVPIQNGVE